MPHRAPRAVIHGALCFQDSICVCVYMCCRQKGNAGKRRNAKTASSETEGPRERISQIRRRNRREKSSCKFNQRKSQANLCVAVAHVVLLPVPPRQLFAKDSSRSHQNTSMPARYRTPSPNDLPSIINRPRSMPDSPAAKCHEILISV